MERFNPKTLRWITDPRDRIPPRLPIIKRVLPIPLITTLIIPSNQGMYQKILERNPYRVRINIKSDASSSVQGFLLEDGPANNVNIAFADFDKLFGSRILRSINPNTNNDFEIWDYQGPLTFASKPLPTVTTYQFIEYCSYR